MPWDKKLLAMLPHLDERQRRIYLALEAQARGGTEGIESVVRVAKCSPSTIYLGLKDLESGQVLPAGTRRKGGGRKAVETVDEELKKNLESLVAPETRGDPMSPLRWTTKSTRNLAESLKVMGHSVSSTTVGRLLKEMGYSLQGNLKTKEGSDHPGRGAQFDHINKQVNLHQAAGNPVISVDCKKKELIGEYKNGGQEWTPKGEPEKVGVYDFVNKDLGKAIPYGIYDVNRNEGYVHVGSDHDTSAFAVESIRRWWKTMGRPAYPEASELLITCDGGGSNDYRRRQWKFELAKFAADEGIKIQVCHLPPGTSKWNKIEHRLFSVISMNWRGRPLTSHEVVVNLIGSTTTRTGLKVKSALDQREYPLKTQITDEQMAAIPLERNSFRGELNYTILARPRT